jgi:inner membrane protein
MGYLCLTSSKDLTGINEFENIKNMRAITHISFSLFTLGIMSGITKLPVGLESIIISGIASLLPDIDTRESTLGKILYPISNKLERQFGHRTITHSFIGVFALSIILLPLLIFKPHWYYASLIGYVSHLLIDCVNKTGVPFLYPNNTYFVFPGSSKWRISVGSLGEYILCALIILLTWGTLYLNNIGLRSWFSSVLGSPELAVKEYRNNANSYQMNVKVKGFYPLSQRIVNDEMFSVIDSDGNKSLIVKNIHHKLITIGETPNNTIQAHKMVIIKNRPIKIESNSFVFNGEKLGLIFKYLDENTYISGSVNVQERAKYLKMDLKPFHSGEFESIKISTGLNEYDSKLEFKDATLEQIKPLENTSIVGELVSRKMIYL